VFISLGSMRAALGDATLALSVFNFTIAAVILAAGAIDLHCTRVEQRIAARR
jgi:hypothetical protein